MVACFRTHRYLAFIKDSGNSLGLLLYNPYSPGLNSVTIATAFIYDLTSTSQRKPHWGELWCHIIYIHTLKRTLNFQRFGKISYHFPLLCQSGGYSRLSKLPSFWFVCSLFVEDFMDSCLLFDHCMLGNHPIPTWQESM